MNYFSKNIKCYQININYYTEYKSMGGIINQLIFLYNAVK